MPVLGRRMIRDDLEDTDIPVVERYGSHLYQDLTSLQGWYRTLLHHCVMVERLPLDGRLLHHQRARFLG
jgi:hypothetical protein